MIESKKGGLSISVETTKLVGDVAIGMCFPLDCNSCAFHKLCKSQSCPTNCFPSGSEEAALGCALGLAVRQALCGDPLAVLKTKVASVDCVAHNGMLSINWKVKGTGSAVRKSIGIAIKNLEPSKMFSAWSRCIKQLGGSVNKESFLYVADAAVSAIKSQLQILVVGNIKIDKPKLDDMIEILSKKHSPTSVTGSKSKPKTHTPCDHSEYTELKVTGWASAVFADYVRAKVRGLEPILCDKYILMPIKQAQWDTLAKKLKKGVKDFARMKYEKVGENLPAVFGYLTLSNGTLCACDAKTAINSKLNTASIESAISKHL